MFKKIMMAGLMSATIFGSIAPAYAQRGEGSWRGVSAEQRGQAEAARAGGGRAGGDAPRWQSRDSGQQARDNRWQQMREQRPAARPEQPQQRSQWQGGPSRDISVRPDRQQTPGARPQGREDAQSWRDRRDADGRVSNRRGDDRRGSEWRSNDRRDNDRRGDNRWNNDDRRWRGNGAAYSRFDDRTRWNNQRRWDNGWRQDRRYDWRSYRSRYGDRYRVGRYYAPRGWEYGYRRYSVGIFLNSLLFSNSYWIDNSASYRLPPAYGTLRWVRYYDDAILVDIRDGYVVDVIHDFFW